METRRLGRTGQMSSIITFGNYALLKASQKEADAALDMAREVGINHIDVSPVYGLAEERIGSWIKRNGQYFFLGCKTHQRDKESAWESIRRSLDTLNVDRFDLFQFHGVDSITTVKKILGPGGAMEAVLEARDQGLLKYIGITGHRPDVQNQALELFNFDTVMFPLNRVHAAHPEEWNDFRPLLKSARLQDTGVLVIKSIAKQLWENPDDTQHAYQTWYEPFDDPAEIEKSLWYALSQDITSAVLPGDFKLWPAVIDAAERFKPLDLATQQELVAVVADYQPLVGPNMD
jgi:aryl-alcohol dehydrogenase-like predicted oxidoreductase